MIAYLILIVCICTPLYGCELWDLSCKYIDEFKVAWRKIKRRVWRLPAQTHNTIVRNLTCDVDHQLDNRMLKPIHMCLNHHNKVCRSLLLSKVNCKNSTFTSNYHYLSCKGRNYSAMYIDTSHLLVEVEMKHQEETKCCSSRMIIELCEIRDGSASCKKIIDSNICKLIDSICLE